MQQSFGEKYQMSDEWQPVYSEYAGYTGHTAQYVVPETLEVREIFVPTGASVIETMLRDLHKAS